MYLSCKNTNVKTYGRCVRTMFVGMLVFLLFWCAACVPVEAETVATNQKILKLKNQYMETFEISDNQVIEEIIIDSGESLQEISIENCSRLKSLTVKTNISLQKISIKNCNNLKVLESKNNVELEKIQIENSHSMKNLRLINNDLLKEFLMDEDVRLTNLTVSECGKLTSIGNIDLSGVEELQLTDVPVLNIQGSSFPKLKKLEYYGNFAGNIEFGSAKNLKYLNVRFEKKMKVLDLRKFPKLEKLTWTQGKLTKVRFGKKGKLRSIDLRDNRLTGAWNMDGFKKLRKLNVSNNRITSLDMGNLKQEMDIYCSNNRMKTFRAWNISLLDELQCQKNPGIKIYLYTSDAECKVWNFGKKAKVYYRYP